jgi:hypothetical protein
MAFLDNSGDIILDAVLTDTGRMRLAKGDGSFKITKFALGDDEIDYSLYHNSNHSSGASHASGSAYYDLNILTTPILEAFTNNTSSMKSKLVSISRTNLLYLPVLRINENQTSSKKHPTLGAHIIAVDADSEKVFGKTGTGVTRDGVLFGENYGGDSAGAANMIVVDQGLDTEDIPSTRTIDNDLRETQYIIEMDNRFGSLIDPVSNSAVAVSYIDDDDVASYYVSSGTNANVSDIPLPDPTNTMDGQVIKGPRGTRLKIKVSSSLELNSSTTLFTKLGSEATTTDFYDSSTTEAWEYYYIDTNIRITGATTGYSIDIPVRYVKVK